MSDQWNFFPCQMGEHLASIFFDYGIHEILNASVPIQLLNIRIVMKNPRPDGLSSSEEFPILSSFEDALQTLVQKHQSFYVGRITVAEHRDFYVYTSDSEQEWAPRLETLGKKQGYQVMHSLRPDENHDGYWKELYPTNDDWQVIRDLALLETLDKHGDDGTIPRHIDHWAFLPSQSSANQFCQWLQEQGYNLEDNEMLEEGNYRIRFSHHGTVLLSDITVHTITISRIARDLGGDYDGWETPVCKGSAEANG